MIPELEDALHLDYETRSNQNLRVTGPWVYGEHWSTSVWTACFARGEGDVEAWHPGDPVPDTIARAARDGVPFVAHNVGFERAITATQMATKHGWPIIPIEQWWCTASMAAAMALPRDLERAGTLMGCAMQKDMEGHALMKKMMKPSKTVKCLACNQTGHQSGHVCGVCGGHGVILYWVDDAWSIARGTEYCKQDVRTERDLATKVRPLPPREREIWILDQKMNERGVGVDVPLVRKSLAIATKASAELNEQLKFLTGPSMLRTTQVQKLRIWLAFEGLVAENLSKETIAALLESKNLDAGLRAAIELRKEAAKTSTAKLNAYLARVCLDGMMRDNLMYHGANTGRWSGRGAQLQNLPSRFIISKDQINAAIWMIEQGWTGAEMAPWIDTPLETISACLKGMIVPPAGYDFIAADYNAIEARMAAWLASAGGLLGVFARGEDPYLFMASLIYPHVDLRGIDWSDKAQVNAAKERWSHERQIGKIAVLGLGYQMGWEKFQATCAKDRVLIGDQEAKEVVVAFREGNPEIPDLWKDLEDAAISATVHPGQTYLVADGKLRFMRAGKWLYLGLPSGRILSYANPTMKKREMPWIDDTTGLPAMKWGVSFQGINSMTHRWSWQHAYGGKWLENADQGASRDKLAYSQLRLEEKGYMQVLSVHDEPVSIVPYEWGSVKEVEQIMCEDEDWCPGLPVKAEGWRGPRYRK
jgi:DNA polymerase